MALFNLADYDQLHRVAPLTAEDLQRIPGYVRPPFFAHHLRRKEIEALGCKAGLYHSPFARVRWPGLNHREPSTKEAQDYVRGFLGDARRPERGVPFPRLLRSETSNHYMAKWILDHSWHGSKTDEWPVRRWLTWDYRNAPYPARSYPHNPNWHDDAGNASITWPLHPISEAANLQNRLNHSAAHLQYGLIPGQSLRVVHLDNFNLPWGGNRPYAGCVLGEEYDRAYLEMIRVMADLLHERGMRLVVNNLRPDAAEEIWRLPFDGLHMEYGFEDDVQLGRTAKLLNGRPFYCKSRRIAAQRDFQRIYHHGGRVVLIWPDERRPVAWFQTTATRWS